jgi:MFS family permease
LMLAEYRGIPSQARLLIYLSFIPGMVIGLIYFDLSYFLPKVQGLSDFSMGITIGTMAVSMVLASFPLGMLADMYGRRKMLILGNLSASLSLIGFALTSNPSILLLVAIVEGIGEAAFAVSFTSLLADKAGDEKRTAAFSLSSVIGWIAGALGASMISSVIVLESAGLSGAAARIVLYITVGIVGLSATPAILKIRESKPSASSLNLNRRRLFMLPKKSGRILLRFAVYSSAIALGAGLFVPLMARWFAQAYGVSDAVSGPVLAVSGILTAVASFIAPRLAIKLGLVRAIVITQGLSTVFMALVPGSRTFEIAATLYTIRVFMMNLSNPLSQSLIMGLVSPDERGMASGISAALWRLPNGASLTVGAYLIGIGMLALPFYIATVLYVSAITMFWFLFKDTKLLEETQEEPRVMEPAVQEATVRIP